MVRICFFWILTCFVLTAHSQNSLSGKVLDSLSRAPIQFVNVYFANTTIGTVTDAKGEFTIKGFANGKYNLTISFVGFNTVQKSVDFNNNDLYVTIGLIQQIIELKEVSVKADSSDWKENLEIFKSNFLGRTKNASRMVISNPKNLRLFYDKSDSTFVAFAKQAVEIENRMLGYKVFYQLIDFEIDYKKGKMDYRGIPRFVEMEPKGPRELGRWEAERKRAYNGSFSHFIRSLKNNALEANGFEVYTMLRVPDKSRPDDAYLVDKIMHLRKKFMAVKGSTLNRTGIIDSLNYYSRKYYSPKFVDSLGRKITDARELFAPGSNSVITYKGILQVTFKNEPEENAYTPGDTPQKKQTSIIHFLGDRLKVYDNGYYENVSDVFFDGYMGWSEKLAELLPQEYVPIQEKSSN